MWTSLRAYRWVRVMNNVRTATNQQRDARVVRALLAQSGLHVVKGSGPCRRDLPEPQPACLDRAQLSRVQRLLVVKRDAATQLWKLMHRARVEITGGGNALSLVSKLIRAH